MADTKAGSERLEAEGGHFAEVADAAVGDDADAAERPVQAGVHLADIGADDGGLVEILDDEDFRARHARDVVAVSPRRLSVALVIRVARLDDESDRAADHGPELWHEIAHVGPVDGGAPIARGDLLPAIIDGRRRQPLEAQEVALRQACASLARIQWRPPVQHRGTAF